MCLSRSQSLFPAEIFFSSLKPGGGMIVHTIPHPTPPPPPPPPPLPLSTPLDPANFTDVPDDQANSTEVFNCLKLPWRRYGLGLPYNFLGTALAFHSLSLTLPLSSSPIVSDQPPVWLRNCGGERMRLHTGSTSIR